MADMNREGHRQRLKAQFFNKPNGEFQDHHLLELLLFYSIPRKDVKPIAYNLINRFGSLENVFKADIPSLMSVDGVGENTAILISLVNAIEVRNQKNKNKDVKHLKSSKASAEYAKNILRSQSSEAVLMITLDNDMRIISDHILSEGSAKRSKVSPHSIVSWVIKDNASSVIIAHNHPNGKAIPSAEDVNFTISVLSLLRTIDVSLKDHVIVGEDDVCCMAIEPKYKGYFK